MNNKLPSLDDLCIVDVSLEGYDALLTEQETDLRHFADAESALRQGDFALTALWLVSMRLPDMDGAAFLGLARKRSRQTAVFLIGEAYSPADEVAARVAGASAYLWKPADEHWLKLCRHALSRAATRKGMEQTLR